MIKNRRNATVDSWRIIFSLLILLVHARTFSFISKSYISNGSIGVDFFFIVSGWFLVASAQKNALKNPECKHLGSETVSFLFHKYSRIFVFVVISEIFSLVSQFLICDYSLMVMLKNTILAIPDALFLQMTGINSYSATGTVWYLSAMLIVMAMFYPLIRKHGDIFCKVASPLIAVLLLGVLTRSGLFGHPGGRIFSVFNRGLFTGFADIALGIVAFEISSWLQKQKLNKFSRTAATAASRIYLIIAILAGLLLNPTMIIYVVVLFMVFPIAFMLSGHDIIAEILPTKFCKLFSNFSLALYLNHYYWYKIISTKFSTSVSMFFFATALSVLSAVLCMLIVELFNKLNKKYSFKYLFISKNQTSSEVQT